MKTFLEWPLDGQIGLITCLIALVCLLTGPLIDSIKDRAEPIIDGFIDIKPTLGQKIFMIGLILITGLMSYGALQAGNCFSMTADENIQNKWIAFGLASIFSFSTIWYITKLNFYTMKFNSSEMRIKRPFAQERKYRWSNLQNLTEKFGNPGLIFEGTKPIWLPLGNKGKQQLINFIKSKLNDLNKPILPIYYPQADEILSDKRLLIIVFELLSTFEVHFSEYFIGLITSIDEEKITLLREDGTTESYPTNLRNLTPFDDRIYVATQNSIPPGTEADFILICYKHKP